MLCKWCNTKPAKKTFCSHPCRNSWTSYNNRTNNPIHNKESLERMRQSLTGKKLPDSVKRKMSETRRKIIRDNPDLLKAMLAGAESKYLSKVRGTSWRLCRLKALERDNYTCRQCGQTNRKLLVVHHLDYRGKNLPRNCDRNNELSNLVTWCHKCHNRFHRHKSKDYHERMAKIAP